MVPVVVRIDDGLKLQLASVNGFLQRRSSTAECERPIADAENMVVLTLLDLPDL